MRTQEGVGVIERTTTLDDLSALTRLMDLSRRVADIAVALRDPAQSMEVMETADKIAEEVGVLAERCGYTMDEVTRPLWAQ